MKKVEDSQILSAIAELTAACGYPPTFRELGKRLDLNGSATFARVDLLRKAGIILPSGKAAGDGKQQEGTQKDGTKTRGLMLSAAGWQRLGQTPARLSALRREQRLPVFRSAASLARYLEAPAHRERVTPAAALAEQDVQLIPMAALRSEADARQRAAQKPSFVFQRTSGG